MELAAGRLTEATIAMRILITDGTGQIGGNLRQIAATIPGVTVRAIVPHQSSPRASAAEELVPGRIGDLPELRSALRGVDAVLHTASYGGIDPGRQVADNALGTRALMRDAVRLGVGRVIAVSDVDLYGAGPFRGERAAQLGTSVGSNLGRSRLARERAVLEEGGRIVRTSIVYGRGDRTSLPGLLATVTRLGATVEAGAPRLAVIRADHLASALLTLALRRDAYEQIPPIMHAANPSPATLAEILAEAERALAFRAPQRSLTRAAALARGAAYGIDRQRVQAIALDHWFDTSEIQAWRLLPADTRFELDDPSAAWYRSLIPRGAHQSPNRRNARGIEASSH